MIVGYGRVSTKDQCLQTQIDDLKALGCEKIFTEKASGASADARAQLNEMLGYVREGDVVICLKLDRLARNVLDAVRIADELRDAGVALKIMDLDGVDINSTTGRLIYTTISAIAQMEKDRIYERTQRGIQKARDKGVKFGRRITVDPAKVHGLAAQGRTVKEIVEATGYSKTAVYRAIKMDYTLTQEADGPA